MDYSATIEASAVVTAAQPATQTTVMKHFLD